MSIQGPKGEILLTTTEAAAKLQVTIQHLSSLCRDKTLAAHKIGRDWFVPEGVVDGYLKALWEGRRGTRLMRPPHLRQKPAALHRRKAKQ